ncbi:MAG TPA: NAD(P)/FAD-dependent oxidoreductase [Burkholderiales bacterium]|nr:NAD(P)/FAD-dependent oxidoreductase [Burkholderiales bacterium]
MADLAGNGCEILVIGGGPAGSTISALLAQRGRDVLMLEKSHHPRFHIGESLLPLNLDLFERLGVAKEMEAIGMPKYGIEFVAPPVGTTAGKTAGLEFADAWDKSFPGAYQVRRADFDHILFRNAVRKGARAIEGCRVTRVDFRPGGADVAARMEDGTERTWQTRFVVDASGRDTFLANLFGSKERNREHNSAAIFGHFAGATRLPGKAEGNISIFWFDHGWFWFIPLTDGATSIGAVCWPYYMKTRKTEPRQFLLDTIALCPPLAERLRDATLISPVTATGNYSYSSRQTVGESYILLGDAFAFIDPIFSSGVFLAMHSAFVGADTVETCLDRPERARAAMKAYDASVRHGTASFTWFIYRGTSPILRYLFTNPSNRLRMQAALLSILAGDIFRGTPTRLSLLAFKAVYYAFSLLNLKTSFKAWLRRKQIIAA